MTGDDLTFNRYLTIWDRVGPEQRSQFSGYDAFYRSVAIESIREGIYAESELEVVAEHNWILLGRPHYKIWPAYAVMLSRTSLNIPVEVLKVPYDVFAAILPLSPIIFRFPHSGRQLFIKSMLVCSGEVLKTGLRHISVIIDDGETYRSVLCLHLLDGTSIEECLAKVPRSGDTSEELIDTALRLAVAVSLLAVSVHRCVEHDVIRALRERYDSASSDSEREALAEKSIRRGTKGWRIGRGRCLALTTSHDDRESEGGGKELTYQHVRGGHFHTVRHGSRHSLCKVMFFEPTVVRPDLPLPPFVEISNG